MTSDDDDLEDAEQQECLKIGEVAHSGLALLAPGFIALELLLVGGGFDLGKPVGGRRLSLCCRSESMAE